MRVKVRVVGEEGFQRFYNRVCEGLATFREMQYTHFAIEYECGRLWAFSGDGETVLASMVIVDEVLGAVVDELQSLGIGVDFDGDERADGGWDVIKVVDGAVGLEVRHSDGVLVLSILAVDRGGLLRGNFVSYPTSELFDLADPGSIGALVRRIGEVGGL